MTVLDQEIATYNSHLPELLAHIGKFVLIQGDRLVGTFDSYQDAMKCGYMEFKMTPFLVKQIAPAEPIAYFTRDFAACPA